MQGDSAALLQSGDNPTNDVVEIRGRLYSRSSYHLRNIDLEEGKYLQHYPMLNGPVRKMNQCLRRKIGDLANWHISVSSTPADRIDCQRFDLDRITPAEARRSLVIAAPRHEIAHHLWKLVSVKDHLSKPDARVLCFGAGNGLECRIITAMNPTAQVIGTDFIIHANVFHTKMKEVPHTKLSREFGSGSFDLVYSNHTLEHIYGDVGLVLSNVYEVLRPGGCFLSALPCEASSSNPVKDRLPELIRKNSPFGYSDIDPGHPWKTDVFDIYDKLTDAGFREIRFFYLAGSYLENIAAVAAKIAHGVPDNRKQQSSTKGVSRLLGRASSLARHLLSNPSLFELAVKLYYGQASKRDEKNRRTYEVVLLCSK